MQHNINLLVKSLVIKEYIKGVNYEACRIRLFKNIKPTEDFGSRSPAQLMNVSG